MKIVINIIYVYVKKKPLLLNMQIKSSYLHIEVCSYAPSLKFKCILKLNGN